MGGDILKKLGNYTLLFVENEQGIRDNFTQYFELLFKTVYVGKNGLEGYELFKEYNPDLIITDIKMPKLNGVELVKKIREVNNQTSIVIISAHTDSEYLLDSIPLGLIEYIVKPLSEKKLMSVFEKFIEKNDQLAFIYDKDKSITIVDGITHTLTYKENLFLEKIVYENRIISYEEIEFDIWDDSNMSQNALRVFIKNLRKKLPLKFIKNIPNHGYWIDKTNKNML